MAIELCLFDMDGTIVQYAGSSFQSSWDAIGIAAGKGKEWIDVRDLYWSKIQACAEKKEKEQAQRLYAEWFKVDCLLLKDVSIEKISPHIFPPPYTPGFREFCAYLKNHHIRSGIISSGVDLVANQILKELDLNFAIANKLPIIGGKFQGTGELLVSLAEKSELVKTILKEYQIPPEKAAFFGDHINDIPAWKIVGLPIAISPKKPELKEYVKHSFEDFYQALEFFKSEHKI